MRRYYLRKLLLGSILFLFVVAVLLLAVGGLEYALWMPGVARGVLFWTLLIGGCIGLFYWVIRPALELFNLKEGLSQEEGSRIIGDHFPEVGDRLLNLLELAKRQEESELLMASIDQRSAQLTRIPFIKAVKFSMAYRRARLLLIPLAVLALILITGKAKDFFGSYNRVMRYEASFSPPAPFSFNLLNDSLRVLENAPVVIRVSTVGSVQPEEVTLWIGNRGLVMSDRLTYFETTLNPPLDEGAFYFEANGWRSAQFDLEVLQIPLIDRFNVRLDYPKYLNRKPEEVQGTGDISAPEGTRVSWELTAVHTDAIQYSDKDTLINLTKEGNSFSLQKRVYSSGAYTLSTSNTNLKNYEALNYGIDVVRDEYPRLAVEVLQDSVSPEQYYFSGAASDDHGISSLSVVISDSDTDKEVGRISLQPSGSNYQEFYYTFPSGIAELPPANYELYFAVRDNDGLRNGKVAKSQVFNLRVPDSTELEQRLLQNQKGILSALEKTREKQKEASEAFDKELDLQRERQEMGFNESRRLKETINRQIQQEKLMEKFSRELKESFEQDNSENEFKELLEERLERQEIEARKNAALMKEMQEIIDKLSQEELQEQLEEMGKQQAQNDRSLQQLLELTKRYYVQQQARALAQRLEKMAKRQETLSGLIDNYKDSGLKEQEKLSGQFDSLRIELRELERANQDLREPMPWKRNKGKEEAISGDQKDAERALENYENAKRDEIAGGTEGQNALESNKAANKQRGAARKMKELAEALNEEGGGMGGSSESQNAEDAEMLRQILENLVSFSLEEERLFDQVQRYTERGLNESGDIRRQQELRNLFEHVDDSLLALSLRRPEISETINKQIGEVYYNMDKSLEVLAESQWLRGASYQQYTITASNELAAMLAQALEQMQQSMMPGKGSGGGDFQLPDIIKSQQELQQKMQGGSSGESQKGQSGEEGNQGEQGNTGNEGEGGEQGASGSQGKGGQQGQQGASGQEGSEGKSGGSGKNGQSGEQGGSGSTGKGKNGDGNGSKGEGNNSDDNGRNGNGKGSGEGGSELNYEEVYGIYKEQQRIRMQLEQQLEDLIQESDKEVLRSIAREMEQFENELLRSGITERTATQVNAIQQRLMQLENASFEQEEESRRTSNTNEDYFINPIITRPEVFERIQNTEEILNRQVLPLRLNYKDRVKSYFRERTDSLPQERRP